MRYRGADIRYNSLILRTSFIGNSRPLSQKLSRSRSVRPITPLQLRILKVGAAVRELKTKIKFHFPMSFPLKGLYRQILFNLNMAYS